MRRWKYIVFSLSSLTILLILGLKLHELDMPAARFVRSFNIHEINRTGDFFGVMGQGIVIGGAFAVVAVAGWWFRREHVRAMGVRGVVAQVGVGVVSQLLKHLIGRPRPRFAHADEFLLGPSVAVGLDSFPSGHTINSFAAATVVSWFLPQLRIPMFVLAGLVGISRVVRGSHFPTDVYGGAILGILVGSLIAAGFRRWKDSFLPTFIQTGVPVIVFVFLGIWVALHRAPDWSQEKLHLASGALLLLLGVGIARWKPEAWLGRAVSASAIALGVAVACGPWWIAALLLVAVLPICVSQQTLPSVYQSHGEGAGASPWKNEALAVTMAVLGMAILLSMQGLLPIAS